MKAKWRKRRSRKKNGKKNRAKQFFTIIQAKKKNRIYRIQFMPKTGGCETTVNKHRFIEKYSMVIRHHFFSFSFSTSLWYVFWNVSEVIFASIVLLSCWNEERVVYILTLMEKKTIFFPVLSKELKVRLFDRKTLF